MTALLAPNQHNNMKLIHVAEILFAIEVHLKSMPAQQAPSLMLTILRAKAISLYKCVKGNSAHPLAAELVQDFIECMSLKTTIPDDVKDFISHKLNKLHAIFSTGL